MTRRDAQRVLHACALRACGGSRHASAVGLLPQVLQGGGGGGPSAAHPPPPSVATSALALLPKLYGRAATQVPLTGALR